MTRKIALEEAITMPPTEDYLPITLSVAPTQESAAALAKALEDSDQRIAEMDAAGSYKVSKDPDRPRLKKEPSEYFRSNLIITTTGVCQDSALQCALAEMGEDRVLFSVDYPYEAAGEAAEWSEHTPLTDAQREKICYRNAERVLRLNNR